jgi:hypothetical protein
LLLVVVVDIDACISFSHQWQATIEKNVKLPWHAAPTYRIAHAQECCLLVMHCLVDLVARVATGDV